MIITLFQPQIPQNTGNILRTCRVTGAKLYLIRPLGFDMSEKALRRAGLDYAKEMSFNQFDSLQEALSLHEGPVYFLSSKASRSFYDASLPSNTMLVFGNETSGLPDDLMHTYADQMLRLPMQSDVRCLNLSNAVAICTYEVLRQNAFCFT